MGILLNWFTDLGFKVQKALGETWMIILLCFFVIMSLYLAQNVLRASISKTKIVFKWGQIFFLIIFILLTVWFCTLLN